LCKQIEHEHSEVIHLLKHTATRLTAALAAASLAGCNSGNSNVRSGSVNHGTEIGNACASAVAREVGVSPNDVIVTNSTISEGTGNHVVYVGVPYAKADWICKANRQGRVVNVFYSGE
jgi:hypothetical protein